jgi:predicted PurR-regulated permease PerM
MTVIGVLTFIGLQVLGVQLALTLAILAGLLNFIPNFGPILAAVPALIIAIAPHDQQVDLNYQTALYVAVLYMAVQAAEGSVITPLIQQRAVALPPALIVVFQVLLAVQVGPLGLILATPVLAAILVAVKMLYIEDVLGDHGPAAATRAAVPQTAQTPPSTPPAS